MALSALISLSILLFMCARITLRFVHFFQTVFTVMVSIVMFFTYTCIAALNFRVFTPSEHLGAYCCFLIMGFITVPSIALISSGIIIWRNSLPWKFFVWLGSSGVLLGLEVVAVQGKAIAYHDWSVQKSFVAWVAYCAALFILVHLYRRILRKEVHLP